MVSFGAWEGLKKLRGGVALRCDRVSDCGEMWGAMGTRFVTKVMIFETSVEDLATSEKHLGLPRCPEPCQLTKVVSFSNEMQHFR